MPCPTLHLSGSRGRALGLEASWAESARRPSRLDFSRPTFRAVESLEPRHVFSAAADPPVHPPLDDALPPADTASGVVREDLAWQSATIQALLLRINGKELWLERSEARVFLVEGDELEVIGARLATTDELEATGGVLQLEGYVRMPHRRSELGEFDYDGGRFSGGMAVSSIGQRDVQPGLNGGWEVGAGFNRMSVALVHYVDGDVAVVDRFFVNLQTATPDFVISGGLHGGNSAFKTGQWAKFDGEWSNKGGGEFWTYAELDVYHESDLTRPVWVGTLTGETGPGDRRKGTFENNSDDAFDRWWRPQHEGTYVVKAFVDPENTWHEGNEGDNVVTFKVSVVGSNTKGD
jgi:hypothetical protein